MRAKKIVILLSLTFVLLVAFSGGAIADRVFGFRPLDILSPRNQNLRVTDVNQKILKEESVAVDVVERVSPSVVTVSIETPRRRVTEFNPFGGGFSSHIEGGSPQDIGTGFIVSADGLVITNKHVVSETGAKYKVITKDNQEYPVTEINRDPLNDVAILKIDANNLPTVEIGESETLKVGQFVIAIGTALGEFRHTVTTGVISGLGRGISAGNPLQGFVEELDNVIQTDAAINPGNSGGPLLNSAGQVIGVNVAVAAGAQNVGFAIPIKIIKDGLAQFAANGKFAARPFLGVQYQMLTKQAAVLNNLPQGAYVRDVLAGSPAEKVGILVDDIITKFDGVDVNEASVLGDLISKKKVGDSVKISVYRGSETIEVTATLAESSASE